MKYFMVATTKLMDGDDEPNEEEEVKLTPRYFSPKLIDEAQLHVATLQAFSTEIFLIFGFFAL